MLSRWPRPLWQSRQLTCVMPMNVSNTLAVIWSMMSCVGPLVTTDPTRKFGGPSTYVLEVEDEISSVAIWLYGFPFAREVLIHCCRALRPDAKRFKLVLGLFVVA